MKRRVITTCAIIFLLCLFSLSWAAPQRIRIVRKTILDYKEELKLTDAQVKKIRRYMDDLKKRSQGIVQKIKKLEVEVRNMLQKGESLKKIKSKIYEIYKLKAELVIADLETGRKIEGVLNKRQLEKWREIKKREMEKIKELLKRRNVGSKK